MPTSLTVGQQLPSVGLRATDGYLLNLRSFVTKQPAVLLFFAAPTVKGAERERGMAALRALVADHRRLHDAGIAVAGVSCDSEEQQREFAAEQRLPFLLFSDERRTAVETLGIPTTARGDNVNVARPVGVAVDREGVVRAVIERIDPHHLVDQVMRVLSEPMRTAATGTSAGDASAGDASAGGAATGAPRADAGRGDSAAPS